MKKSGVSSSKNSHPDRAFPTTSEPLKENIGLNAPANSDTVYHNYKGFFSILFLALVDMDYKFL